MGKKLMVKGTTNVADRTIQLNLFPQREYGYGETKENLTILLTT